MGGMDMAGIIWKFVAVAAVGTSCYLANRAFDATKIVELNDDIDDPPPL
jgi:hypothetical protein